MDAARTFSLAPAAARIHRRRLLRAACVLGPIGALAACAAPAVAPRVPGGREPDARAAAPSPPLPWESRLRGDAVALLGEIHDNPVHHRLRADVLRRACDAGWRPAIVMEQFDVDRQGDLDAARRAAPGDVSALIRQATPSPSGWEWRFYEAVIALALERRLPLRAGNLSSATTARIARDGLAAVFDAPRRAALGLDVLPDARWQAAQEREIDVGHCGVLPPPALPRMAQAQFARDAVMAEVVRRHAAGGVVLLAGNGHVRRDLGVPRWLHAVEPARLWSVGWLEQGATAEAGAYDAVVVTAAAERPDPCLAFRRR